MDWIKRNLYFLLGTLVALGLMGVGGYVLWTQYAAENKVVDDITQQFEEKKRLGSLNPTPNKQNIDAAKDQDKQLRAYINKTRARLEHIEPIPNSPKVANEEFVEALRRTVVDLTNTARIQNVALPADFYFTFAAEKQVLVFEPGGAAKLAVQLGDIKAISDILFNAKINALDRLKREMTTTNDQAAIGNDFTMEKTTTTPLADLVPYEIGVRCFSGDLAALMAGLASSPSGIIIKTINVEPAPEDISTNTMAVISQPEVQNPFNQRGGSTGYGTGRLRRGPNPPPPPPNQVATPTPSRGPGTFLDEKPLKVNLVINLVRLKPEAGAAPAKVK